MHNIHNWNRRLAKIGAERMAARRARTYSVRGAAMPLMPLFNYNQHLNKKIYEFLSV